MFARGKYRSKTLKLEIVEKSRAFIEQYSTIPIAFDVRECLSAEVLADASNGTALRPSPVEGPNVKDYDALPGQRPADWPRRWNLDKWWFAAALDGERYVGAIAIVMDTVEIAGPRHKPDEAMLWDIRVMPEQRRRGVGRALLSFAERHAQAFGKLYMSAETQNINVAACRFYARAGYTLQSVDRFAYPELPQETQLIWRKQLGGYADVERNQR